VPMTRYTRENMVVDGQDSEAFSFKLSSLTMAGIGVASVVYFADIFLKASRKCFWFDELFTVYLCRLPKFADTWFAVTRGADFNPPLLYLLTRGAQRIFGNGLIATRIPSAIGVWIFCICLFLFVARRAGAVSGFIAGAFPLFTLAQYYAYEARAHGIVLGWCGLALVCWQRLQEGRAKYLWLAAFSLSLMGALLTHIYAVYLIVPFAIVEIHSLFRKGRLDWAISAVLVVAPVAVIAGVYLPLLRGYRAVMPSSYFPASHDLIQRFLLNVIGPSIAILLAWLLLTALAGSRFSAHSSTRMMPRREMLVGVGFVFVPVLGLIGCKVSHGPFLDRYFLSSIAGFAIFLGFAGLRTRSWAVKTLAGFMFVLMLADLGTTIYFSKKNRLALTEPSTGLRLSMTPSNPMALYDSLRRDKTGLDILVLPSLEYIYFFMYAPTSVTSRLYYGAPETDVNRGGYLKLSKLARVDLKITTVGQFLATHQRFLAYENDTNVHTSEVQMILGDGYRLLSTQSDAGGILYEYAK
jgi:Dolichyl-phosphate-mannose-protein mannosyltransferase